MVCLNCGRTNERNCVCKICGLVGCETCLDHSLETYHSEHDNDRCKDHLDVFPVPARGSLTMDEIVREIEKRLQKSLTS